MPALNARIEVPEESIRQSFVELAGPRTARDRDVEPREADDVLVERQVGEEVLDPGGLLPTRLGGPDLAQEDRLVAQLPEERERLAERRGERGRLRPVAVVAVHPHPVDVRVTRVVLADGLVADAVDPRRRPQPDDVLVGASRLEAVPDVLPHLHVLTLGVVRLILRPGVPVAVHLVVEPDRQGHLQLGDARRERVDVRVVMPVDDLAQGEVGVGRPRVGPVGVRLPGEQRQRVVAPRTRPRCRRGTAGPSRRSSRPCPAASASSRRPG